MLALSQTIVFICAEAGVSFVTITGNFIVLVAISHHSKLYSFKKKLIAGLAAADLVVGVFASPIALVSMFGYPHNNSSACLWMNTIILIVNNISLYMLLAITIDRFVAVVFPFTYDSFATIRRANMVNAFVWIFGIVTGLPPVLGWNIAPEDLPCCQFTSVISKEYIVYVEFLALTFTPVVLMFCVFLSIRCAIGETRRRLDTQMGAEHCPSRRRWEKDLRGAKIFETVFLLHCMFFLPINLMDAVAVFCPGCHRPLWLILAAILVSHANSAVRPFIYAAYGIQLKMTIKDLIAS